MKTKLLQICKSKINDGFTYDELIDFIENNGNESIFSEIKEDLEIFIEKYGRKRKYWMLKVPTIEWESMYSNEFDNIEEGFIYPQYFEDSHTKPMNNLDDIVFVYNSDKSYEQGIYLLCKITSKMDGSNAVMMEVIKDLRDEPFFYKDIFPKLFLDYNTVKGINKRQQFSMIVYNEYNPKDLYIKLLND